VSDKPAENITNLLPNDTQSVVHLWVDPLMSSSLKKAALDTPGAFNKAAFKNVFGFDFSDVQEVVLALNGGKNGVGGWAFSVVRLKRSLTQGERDKLRENLKLTDEKPEGASRGYQIVRKPLDAIGNLLFKGNAPRERLAMLILDSQTLVFADVAPMAAFVKSN